MRRIPIIPTIIVVLAVATMIALGIWQLGRAEEKEALIARYEAALAAPVQVEFPVSGGGEEQLFQKSSILCENVHAIEATAGRNVDDVPGWIQRATCTHNQSGAALMVDLGWSREPQVVAWSGGLVEGVIASGPRLVVSKPPLDSLQPVARPDPLELPNNHLAYAGQWFFFALTALVIYAIVLRQRWRDR